MHADFAAKVDGSLTAKYGAINDFLAINGTIQCRVVFDAIVFGDAFFNKWFETVGVWVIGETKRTVGPGNRCRSVVANERSWFNGQDFYDTTRSPHIYADWDKAELAYSNLKWKLEEWEPLDWMSTEGNNERIKSFQLISIDENGNEAVEAENNLLADFHTLRYTFITNLCRSNISLTMNIYSHVSPKEQVAAINALPGVNKSK